MLLGGASLASKAFSDTTGNPVSVLSVHRDLAQEDGDEGRLSVTHRATISKQWCDWFIAEGSIFFLSFSGKNHICWGLFQVGPGVSHIPHKFCLDFRLNPPGSLKIVQGHGGLCPQCLCGWNCRNCVLKCRGLNVTGARSAHYGWAGYRWGVWSRINNEPGQEDN